MAYSYQTVTSDGTLQTVVLSIEFFSQAEITVYLNGVAQSTPANYVWATSNSIQFPAPLANGAVVKIQRRTDISEMRHVFAEGALYSDNTIDEDYTQILHIAQENLEGRDLTGPLSQDLDMGGYRVVNMGNPVNPLDAVNLQTLHSYAFDSSGVLRADLLANGTQRVFRPGGVVSTETALQSIESKNTLQDSQLTALFGQARRNSLAVAVANTHFGVQCGLGWNPLESGGLVTTTATANVSAGALTVPVANGLIFALSQLIVYTSTDGKRYTAVVVARTALQITLDRQVRAIASGATIANFFRDDAHANTEGAYALVDHVLDVATRRTSTESFRVSGSTLWTSLASAVLALENVSTYQNPGDTPDGGRGMRVTSPGVGGGAQSQPIALSDGDYELTLDINPGERAGALSGSQTISIDEVTPDAGTFTIATTTVTSGNASGGSQLVSLTFSLRTGSVIRVRVTTGNGGSSYCILGTIRVHRLQGYLPTITNSKIVLFGDSWFTSGGEFHNAMIARLPNATVISAGVPGNRADQGIARFATDVASQSPDVVMVCFSTNDYYQDVTLGNFNQQIHQIRGLIRSIGAIPIFFDPTVGAITPTLPLPNQLTKSRKYYQFVQYRDSDNFATGLASKTRRIAISGSVNVPAGGSVVVAVSPGLMRGAGWVVEASMNQPLLSMRASYSTAVDGAGEADITAFPVGTTSISSVQIPRATTNGLQRFFCFRLVNATGTPTVTAFSAEIEWSF